MTSDGGIRVSKRRGYTLVYNDMLTEGMSARAWGVYVYLLSKPDGWEARIHDLQVTFKEGRDALTAARDELVALGYLRREEEFDHGLLRIRFVLDADQEKPATAQTRRSTPAPGNPYPGEPDAGAPDTADPERTSTDVATTDSTTTDSLGRDAASPAADPAGIRAEAATPPRPVEWDAADWVYERTGKSVGVMALRGLIKRRTKEGDSARDVAVALVALYRSSRAINAQTLAQALDGTLVLGEDGKYRSPVAPTPRPDAQERRNAQIARDREVAAQLVGILGGNDPAALEGGTL